MKQTPGQRKLIIKQTVTGRIWTDRLLVSALKFPSAIWKCVRLKVTVQQGLQSFPVLMYVLRSSGMDPYARILILSTKQGGVHAALLPANVSRYLLNRWLGGFQSRSGIIWLQESTISAQRIKAWSSVS